MTGEEIDRWLPRPYARAGARLRLFCFPQAATLLKAIAPWVEGGAESSLRTIMPVNIRKDK